MMEYTHEYINDKECMELISEHEHSSGAGLGDEGDSNGVGFDTGRGSDCMGLIRWV